MQCLVAVKDLRVDSSWNSTLSIAMAALDMLAWVSVALCVPRGLPVIIHSLRHDWPTSGKPETAPH